MVKIVTYQCPSKTILAFLFSDKIRALYAAPGKSRGAVWVVGIDDVSEMRAVSSSDRPA
jgi:hypothetical protein